MTWPLASVRFSVNTSPLACGSARTGRTLGRRYQRKVNRAGFGVEVPEAGSAAAVAAASTMSGTVRMGMTMHRMGGNGKGRTGRNGVSYACTGLKISGIL
jgi:hypothetical protein